MRARWVIVLFLLLAAPVVAGDPTIFRVDDDAPARGDGATWDTAFRFLTDAIVAADALGLPVEIRVAQGRYQPDQSESNPAGTDDRNAAFELRDGVAIRGGYAGLLTPDPDQRDIDAFPTNLSGEVGAAVSTYHVVLAIEAAASAVLDGCVVSGGNADGTCCDPPAWGGGLYVAGGAPTIIDCVFRNNAGRRGGGVSVDGGAPLLERCTFEENTAQVGGGLYASGFVGPTVRQCRFERNTAESGGGLYLSGDGLLVEMSSFEENVATSAGGGGGGMRVASFGEARIRSSQFFTNTTPGFGGAIHGQNSRIELEDCLLIGNAAGDSGGALYGGSDGHWILDDCTFITNVAEADGGGIHSFAPVTATGCLFSGNEANRGGAARFAGGGHCLLACDFTFNTARLRGAIDFFATTDFEAADCTFTGNQALELGGGAVGFSFGASGVGTFVGCDFTVNSAGSAGGAVSLNGGRRFIDCSFAGNTAVTDGGAVFIADDSAPVFEACTFFTNLAVLDGGAVFADGGSAPTFRDTTFANNEALGDGGALFAAATQVRIHGGLFQVNEAASDGGAIRTSSAVLTMSDVLIDANAAGARGGGLFAGGGTVTIRSCDVLGNTAATGGGIHVDSFPSVTISGSRVAENTADQGGGLYLGSGATAVLNSILTGNTATESGGGVSARAGAALTGCTVHANSAGVAVGGVHADTGAAIVNVTNSILWANADPGGETLFAQLAGTGGGIATLSHACVQGLPPDFGFGSFGDDPMFVDAAGPDGMPGTADDDLHLPAASPCVDAGNNLAIDACLPDADGNERRADEPKRPDTGTPRADPPYVDMGAFERVAPPLEDCDGNGVADDCDIDLGVAPDCDRNGVPDACDIDAGAADCDDNGVPDVCDLAAGADDCNGNGVLDTCEIAGADCNGNGIPDDCDIAAGRALDCNGNGVPDACDIGAGTADDCNANGTPDACELADGRARDCNDNGVPDACEVTGPFAGTSGLRSPVGDGVPVEYVLGSVRAAAGAVTIEVRASAELNSSSELIELDVNDVGVASLFRFGATDCADPPLSETVVLTAAVFNTLTTAGQNAVIRLRPFGVSAGACDGASFAEVLVSYDAIGSNDVDGDGVPDDCACIADLDGSGDVGFNDLVTVLAAWGPCPGCPADLDGSGDVGFTDLLQVLADWGACP